MKKLESISGGTSAFCPFFKPKRVTASPRSLTELQQGAACPGDITQLSSHSSLFQGSTLFIRCRPQSPSPGRGGRAACLR